MDRRGIPQRDGRLAALTERGWLSEQDAGLAGEIAAAGVWRSVESRRTLFEAGEPNDMLYGVAGGVIDLFARGPDDAEVLFHRAVPVSWLGDGPMLSGEPALLTARVSSAARLFCVPGARIRALLARQPSFMQPFFALRHRAQKIAVEIAVDGLARLPIARVARRLSAAAQENGEVRLTQSELASLIGATRSTASRALKRLSDDGLISTRYGRIRILDSDRLRDAAD